MVKSNNYNPGEAPDASYGLIFRLNRLWDEADKLATSGKFDDWNFKLDRIFSNLLFKEDLVYEKDDEGNITDVRLSPKDEQMYEYLNKDVLLWKGRMLKSRDPKKYSIAKSNLYKALSKKEYSLRKFMYKLKLYMKTNDKSPAHAMWGG